MLSAQRLMAIRICGAHWTAHTSTVLVDVWQIPWHLQAEEWKEKEKDRQIRWGGRLISKRERTERWTRRYGTMKSAWFTLSQYIFMEILPESNPRQGKEHL